jgi:hypothetical protein
MGGGVGWMGGYSGMGYYTYGSGEGKSGGRVADGPPLPVCRRLALHSTLGLAHFMLA